MSTNPAEQPDRAVHYAAAVTLDGRLVSPATLGHITEVAETAARDRTAAELAGVDTRVGALTQTAATTLERADETERTARDAIARADAVTVKLPAVEAAAETATTKAADAGAYARQAADTAASLDGLKDAVDSAVAQSPADSAVSAVVAQPGTQARSAVSGVVQSTPGRSVAAEASRKLTGKRLVFILRHDDIQAQALGFLPLYREYGVKASWYVVTNNMGTVGTGGAQLATVDDVKMLHAEGHEIGSHTMDHFYFGTGADATTEADRRAQLAGAKKALEDLLGEGYTCETFAYPGNQFGNNLEVLDYYLLGTSGVPTVATVGGNFTGGTLDMAVHKAEYAHPVRASSAEDMVAKVAALKESVASRPGVVVHTLQIHNTKEFSVDEMRWLIEAVKADPELGFITMREYAHYMREYGQSVDGRVYFGSTYSGGATLRTNTPTVSAAGLTVDRMGKGYGIVTKVQGQTVATLDDRLVLSTAVASRLENGHSFELYGPGNVGRATLVQDETNRLNVRFSSSAPGVARVLGQVQAYAPGTALRVTDSASQVTAVDVDATRGTLYVRSLSAVPTGPARVGEMCVVAGKLHMCVTAGDPGTWAEVGKFTYIPSVQVNQSGTSNFEQGHILKLWSSGNTEYARLEHTTTNRLQVMFKNAATGVMRVLGTLSAWTAGKALDLVNAASQLTIFDVDVDRRVAYLRPVDALPTDVSRAGEVCIYQGALYLCTTAGASPVWTKVGGA